MFAYSVSSTGEIWQSSKDSFTLFFGSHYFKVDEIHVEIFLLASLSSH